MNVCPSAPRGLSVYCDGVWMAGACAQGSRMGPLRTGLNRGPDLFRMHDDLVRVRVLGQLRTAVSSLVVVFALVVHSINEPVGGRACGVRSHERMCRAQRRG